MPETARVYSPELGFVEIPRNPGRIASLSPAVTETLFLLGAGGRVVARDSWSYRPREALRVPKVATYTAVHLEKLEALRPALVLTTTGVQLELVRALKGAGMPVYPVPVPSSPYSLIDSVLTVGGLVGRVREAEALADNLLHQLENLPRLGTLRTYVEIDLGGPTVPAAFSHITGALRRMGLENIYGEVPQAYLYGMPVPGYPLFNPGEVPALQPDILVYEAKSRRAGKERFLSLARARGWSRMEAVRKGRVVVLPPDTLAHHGPSFFENLHILARALHEILG